MRLSPLACLALVGASLAPALASGASTDHSVQAISNDRWSPATVNITVGDRVVWTNPTEDDHNVRFFGEPDAKPATAGPQWTEPVTRVFDQAGTFQYYCVEHDEMVGTVVVTAAAATATATGTATATATGTPTSTTTPGGGNTTPTGQPGDFTAQATRTRFCARKRKGCPQGLVLSVDLGGDRPATLRGALRRKPLRGGNFRDFGVIQFSARAGARQYKFRRTLAGRRLGKGRYEMVLERVDGQGPVRTVRFRIA